MAGRIRALVGLSLLALAARAWAAESPAPEPAPTAELLLFLAEFGDGAGNEVDPIALAEQVQSEPDLKPVDAAAVPPDEKHARDDDESPPPR